GLVPNLYRKHEARADAAESESQAIVVSTTRPVESTSGKNLRLPCDVKAYADTMLYPRANGYLKKWYVDINDRVKEGQLLAEIATPDVDAQLDASKATLLQSKAAVETAQSNFNLMKATLDRYELANKNQPGSVTEEDLDTHRSQRDQAAAALKQAQANVGTAQADVERQTVLQGFEKIYAPFDGVVTFRGYDVGALLNPTNLAAGQEIFRIQQTDPLRVYVNVPQGYASDVQINEKAWLKVRNLEQEFEGKVTRSSGSIDPSTRTISFEVDFPNSDNKLYAGMYGQIRLPVTIEKPVLMIPTGALIFNATGTQVAVVVNNQAHLRAITVGRDLGTQLEVSEGLSADDVVIANPGERLVEGVNVQIVGKTNTSATPDKVASKG
ncbi:MAG: efflux RND transporter periplasmic adaptor subunit, partial [Phycisphaerae bacterium]|nr:efflux RND transporter periplasmic adaptor subunit [Phycisphaerae bacterium]